MAYKKFMLNNRDAFQQALAVHVAVRMLNAAEASQPGASEIGYEAAGVGGWDDLVEFGHDSQGPYAHHWQVKDQNTDFEFQAGADMLCQYIQDAHGLISSSDPYSGSPKIAPTRVEFHLRFPGLNICFRPPGTQERTRFVHLRDLCRVCRGNAGAAIAGNQGGNLLSPQHQWLQWVVDWLGGNWLDATTLLGKMTVDTIEGVEWLRDNTTDFLRMLSTDPEGCFLRIQQEIIGTPPEGRLTLGVLRAALSPLGRTRTSRALKLGAQDGRFWTCGPWEPRATDVEAKAQSIVDSVWHRTTPGQVQVDFHPDGVVSSDLCNVALRLILHATPPVEVRKKVKWWDAAVSGCGGSIGRAHKTMMDDEFYVELVSFQRGKPEETYSEGEIVAALKEAMDAAVWSEVERCLSDRLVDIDRNIHDDIKFVRAHIDALGNPFSRILRCWWEHKYVQADLRAGPGVADRIALVILGLAALRHLGYPLSNPKSESAIGALGEVEVRALALSHCSHVDGGGRRGVQLRRYAHRLLEERAVVLLADGDANIYTMKVQSSFVSAGNEPHIGQPFSPALVLSADSLTEVLSSGGVPEAQKWIDQQRSRLNQDCIDALQAARQRWGEQDVA